MECIAVMAVEVFLKGVFGEIWSIFAKKVESPVSSMYLEETSVNLVGTILFKYHFSYCSQNVFFYLAFQNVYRQICEEKVSFNS